MTYFWTVVETVGAVPGWLVVVFLWARMRGVAW